MADPVLIGALAVVTVLGLIMTFFAFELAEPLLRLAGLVAGAIAGAVVGLFVLPALLGDVLTVGERLAATIALVLVGASVGSAVVPAFKRIAIGTAAFVATFVSILLVATGDRVLDAALEAITVSALVADPVGTLETVAADPALQTTEIQSVVAAAAILGLVGGGLGLRYYTDIVALAMTAAGAGLLAIVVPVWAAGLEAGFEIDPAATEFSPPLFAAAFIIGLGYQIRRHLSELDPRSGDAVVGKYSGR